MGGEFIIGCVGKPSAGKSTFFNAATESSAAKVGSYPFTTINPNEGIAHYITECPCKTSLLETFAAQFSGYGAPQSLVAVVLQELQRSRRARSQEAARAQAAAAQAAAAAGLNTAAAAAAAATDDASLMPEDLTKWTAEDVMELVKTFVKVRFPFVLVLNKCDAVSYLLGDRDRGSGIGDRGSGSGIGDR
ncbi:GTP-binding protein, putative [Eimeria praecox]|uniref:GTP-binding protein, putative n=1 Tax=Eimeria praecox TaxID=51316 RepID=U6H3T9_9EIME|nr:GTP-binding protein, putative [Eimeria praecox]